MVALVQLEAAQFQPRVAKEDSDERPHATNTQWQIFWWNGPIHYVYDFIINDKRTKKDNKKGKKNRPWIQNL